MPRTIIDLHLHSTHSDGKLTLQQIVKKLALAGIDFASLTDHDSTAGSKEFAVLAGKAGIKTVSGVEISADQEGIGLHILGFGINTKHAKLVDLFKKQAAERKKSFIKTVDLFQKAGFIIDRHKFNKLKNVKTIAKPHIFELIYETAANRVLLSRKFLFRDGEKPMSKFIQKFMSYPDQLGYVKKPRISCREAIRLIHASGGIAVWAHPGVEEEIKPGNLPKILKRLAAYGLDGLEAFSSAHTKRQMKYFYKLAGRFRLLVTMGSDDHGGTRIGEPKINYKYHKEALASLLSKINPEK